MCEVEAVQLPLDVGAFEYAWRCGLSTQRPCNLLDTLLPEFQGYDLKKSIMEVPGQRKFSGIRYFYASCIFSIAEAN